MKTVIEMAMQSGFDGMGQRVVSPVIEGSDLTWLLERFAELVRADERKSWPSEMEAMERQVNILTDALAEQEPSPGGVLFAVEEAIRNGDCPWQIEQAFDEYEAERKAAHGIKENT